MTDDTRNPVGMAVSSDPETPGGKEISLEDHAKISAEIAEGDQSEAEVLKRHGLSSKQWCDATQRWMSALADDALEMGVEAKLALVYSDYFAAHQQRLKPAPSMTPEQWAELQFDVERSGSADAPLALRRMSLADYMRLLRIYAKRIAEEPEVAMRVEQRQAQLEAVAESQPQDE